MNSRLAGTIALALAVAGTIAAGCGGGEASSAQSGSPIARPSLIRTSPLDKAAYRERINAECGRLRGSLMKKAAAYLGSQGGVHGPLGSPREEASNAKLGTSVIVPTVEAEMTALRRLGAPAGDEDKIESILAADQKGIDEVKSLKKTESIQDILDRFAMATQELEAYGLRACGN